MTEYEDERDGNAFPQFAEPEWRYCIAYDVDNRWHWYLHDDQMRFWGYIEYVDGKWHWKAVKHTTVPKDDEFEFKLDKASGTTETAHLGMDVVEEKLRQWGQELPELERRDWKWN